MPTLRNSDSLSFALCANSMTSRHLFGFSGDSFVSGAVEAVATRQTDVEISAHVSEWVTESLQRWIPSLGSLSLG